MIAGLSLTFLPIRMQAATATASTAVAATGSASATALLVRLHEIKDMDKSTLGATEKKGLRQEVKNIKKQLAAINSGIYLSTGAIIIIVILLIILL